MLEEVSSTENPKPLHSITRQPSQQQLSNNPSSPTSPNISSNSNTLKLNRGARRPTFFGDIAKSALSTPSSAQAGKLNILGALLSHDAAGDSDNSDSSNRSTSPIPVRLRKESVTRRRRKIDETSPQIPQLSPNETFSSLPNFSESSEETKRFVAAIQKTEDISIKLDDSASTVNVNNTIYVKMDFAKTQVEEIMNKFSNAKQEFKEKTKKLQKHFEKLDNEKMAKIQSFMEEFNEKYSSMQKRYQETLSKKYKEKIDDLGGKVKSYALEKDELHDRLVSETKTFYEDMRVYVSSFENIVAGIEAKEKERAEKEISEERLACQKEIEGAHQRLTKSITVQKKLFFGLVNYLRSKEKECIQLGIDLAESRSTTKNLKEQCENQQNCIKEAENREKEYLVIVNNQKEEIIDLGKRLDFYLTKTFSESNVNTDLTSQTLDNTQRDFENQTKLIEEQNSEIEERKKELEKIKLHTKNQSDSIKNLEETITNLQSNIKQLTDSISTLHEEKESLSRSLEQEKKNILSLQETNGQLDVRINELTRKETLMKDILKNQKQKITNFESKLLSVPQEAPNDIQKERDEKQVLQILVTEKESLISSLQTEITKLEAKYNNLELDFLKTREQVPSQVNVPREASKNNKDHTPYTVVRPEQKQTGSQTEERLVEIRELEEFQTRANNQVKDLEKKIVQITDEFAAKESKLVFEAKEQETNLESEFKERLSSIILEFKKKEEMIILESKDRESKLEIEHKDRESKLTSEYTLAITDYNNEKQMHTNEISKLRDCLEEKSERITNLEHKVTGLQKELDGYQHVATEEIDFEKKEFMVRLINSIKRESEILKAEVELRKTVEEELREEIERLKKEIRITNGKYRTLLNQSHFRLLEDNTETVHFEEELDRQIVENKQLLEMNKLLQVQLASFTKDIYFQEFQKFQKLYLAECNKTTKLSKQCKQFVLKIAELEKIIENLSIKCEKAFDDISREKQRIDVARRLVIKGEKEKEDSLIEIENLKHQLEVALEVLRRNQFEQEFYRVLKKSTLIKGIL